MALWLVAVNRQTGSGNSEASNIEFRPSANPNSRLRSGKLESIKDAGVGSRQRSLLNILATGLECWHDDRVPDSGREIC